MASGYIVRRKSKKFSSFPEMMKWAETYYQNHEKLWGPDGYIYCVSYDVTKAGEFMLRGISEWESSIISQVEFGGKYVAGNCDLEHSEHLSN